MDSPGLCVHEAEAKLYWCPHDNYKYTCTKCNPKLKEEIRARIRCIHDLTRKYCKICSPHHWCLHDKYRYACHECTPKPKKEQNRECMHNKRKNHCKICSPHYWCSHNVYKYNCVRCQPIRHAAKKLKMSVICIHGLHRDECFHC
jgi:hypothetical protein